MLDRIFIILAAWFALSMVVALLVGAASRFRGPHPRGFTPSVWTDLDFGEVSEPEAEKTFVYLSSLIQ
jgi:hypothetical protein